MTTTNLVKIYHHVELQIFFLVMRRSKIHSLSNFQMPYTVLLTIVTMLYIKSQGLIYFISQHLYLSTPFTHLPTDQTATCSND